MKAFVTGATGFIGQHLCNALAARGDRIIAMVRNPDKASQLPQGTETFVGDLSRFANSDTVLPECDVVVHLAGVVAANRTDEYDAVNFSAVKDLVSCLSRQAWKPKRVLFASSLAAAGPSSREAPWTEADDLEPIDAYGVAKAKAEAAFASAPWPATVFRPPIVFGPLDTATLTLYKAARDGLGFRVAGEPQRLSFVDVRDLVDGLLLMADDRRAGSFTYYTSHPESFDVIDLWRELGAAVGRSVRVLPVPRGVLYAAMLGSTAVSRTFGFKNQLDRKQFDQMTARAFLCSGEKLQRDLGWRPRFGLADALSNSVAGYREAGWL
jgi:nucleoside-diphosphate-sugar epimerase